MDNASCSTTVTELDTNEIVPSRKFVPIDKAAAATKVNSNTGTSACDVKINTVTTMIATSTLIVFISDSICSADASPMEVDT